MSGENGLVECPNFVVSKLHNSPEACSVVCQSGSDRFIVDCSW